uniref:Plasminogen n=1 Tax=Micrurus fulvius TaxID=8637 RepID=U3ERR1_MICFL
MPTSADLPGCVHLSDQNQPGLAPAALVTLDNLGPIARPRGGDDAFERLPYQLSMVLSAPTMVTTGNGESGFDSGEGA